MLGDSAEVSPLVFRLLLFDLSLPPVQYHTAIAADIHTYPAHPVLPNHPPLYHHYIYGRPRSEIARGGGYECHWCAGDDESDRGRRGD